MSEDASGKDRAGWRKRVKTSPRILISDGSVESKGLKGSSRSSCQQVTPTRVGASGDFVPREKSKRGGTYPSPVVDELFAVYFVQTRYPNKLALGVH
jgi:hypothetical protein